MGMKISKQEEAGPLHFHARTGTVIADKAWGRSTGEGHIGNHGGFIDIKNTDVTRLFVEDDNGQEFKTELAGTSVVAREGHRISCLYATKAEGNTPQYVAFINHSMGNWQMFDNALDPLLGITSLNGCGLMVILSLLSIFVIPIVAPTMFLLGIPLGILFDMLRNKRNKQARRQEVVAHIRTEVQRIIDEEKMHVR